MRSEDWEGVSQVKRVGEKVPGTWSHSKIRVSMVLWGIERNRYGSCRKSWRRTIVQGIYMSFQERICCPYPEGYSGQQNILQLSAVLRHALSLESHLAPGTRFLKLPASGDSVRQGHRGTATWPGGGHSRGQYSPQSSWWYIY